MASRGLSAPGLNLLVVDFDVDALRAIEDPAERVVAVRAELARTDLLRTELAMVTHEAVVEMRRSMTLAAVAAVLGVSVGRVNALEKPPGSRPPKVGPKG
jgi:hypothetical protein